MDRSWIFETNRLSKRYIDGVKSFMEFAKAHSQGDKIRCPCRNCLNAREKHFNEVEAHLFMYGISQIYTRWINHGEQVTCSTNYPESHDVGEEGFSNNEENDDVFDILKDVHDGMFTNAGGINETNDYREEAVNDLERDGSEFYKLLKEAQCELYPGCEKVSVLSFTIKLLHLKVTHHWSNKSVSMLLELFKEILPNGAKVPRSHYDAKKMLRGLGLGCKTIDACKYDCALFWKEHEKSDVCPECGESRWKISNGTKKKIPNKILRYFPLTPRLQRLFLSRHTAKDMRWHKEKRVDREDVISHPADSVVWKEFDKEYTWFADDPRNVRLGLATDGFNPFGNLSNAYSMWPVVLTPYNLPPWKCMKEPFFMMSLLIPGPQAPGKDIDIYMQPLIDELKELWTHGARTYDIVAGSMFDMHASVLWTINDFPAYANLSGWSTKGYMACPVCKEDTSSQRLRNKLCYIGHRRFLPPNHTWRKSNAFDGMHERRLKPNEQSSEDIFQEISGLLETKHGKHPTNKKRKRTKEELNWTHRSILFELPYWRKLILRHNLDVMHIEKNICENIIGTLLNIEGKTKDTINARMDLADMNIRKELHVLSVGGHYVKPQAHYVMEQKERTQFCEFLKSVKFPDGYASNIARCVNVKDGKLSGLKSHDCHVLLQRLLPVGLRGLMRSNICSTLVDLSYFFQAVCARTINTKEMDLWRERIVIILCKLEQIFPPAFFDIMIHLAVHLPREAQLAGPVNYRWMYPIERFLRTLKGYVKNKARPEGSISESYIAKECLTFCSMYLEGVETRFNRQERNYDNPPRLNSEFKVFSQRIRTYGHEEYCTLTEKEYDQARWYVLHNCEEISSYLDEHMEELKSESYANLSFRQQSQFPKWFEKRVKSLRKQKSPIATNELYALGCGPDMRVVRYSACIVNGVRFHTKNHDSCLKSQNCGVVVEGDHNGEAIDFYGLLEDVIELKYMYDISVFLFKCHWFNTDPKRSFMRIDYGFTCINTSQTWYKDDPFILANQAQQVFYLNDPKHGKNWCVVQKIRSRHLWDIPQSSSDNIEDQHGEKHDDEQDVFQLLDCNEVNHVEIEDIERSSLHRDGVTSTMLGDINAPLTHDDIEDFVCDDMNEDDTLIDYISDEETKF